ncbi:MAG: putative formyl transferase [Sediminibacterium sp.]|nr:putative formyl transferase [Sediminibacterium sp.]
MKIVCMIGTPVYLHYFVNQIARHHDIALVIREDTHVNTNLFKKIKEKGIAKSIGIIAHRFLNQKKFRADYDTILGTGYQELSDKFPVFNTSDINSQEVIQKLREINPDLVLVHGTSLIKNKTLAGIPMVLNLHWGLSPYYKGSYCTQWALINHDPYNIGYTIHRISSKIDAGDILTQGRIEVEPADTVNRINMRLTKQGTQEMINVINRLKNNEPPEFKEQDNSKGNLYLVKHWTPKQQQQVAALENPVSIDALLKQPSVAALPIIKW